MKPRYPLLIILVEFGISIAIANHCYAQTPGPDNTNASAFMRATTDDPIGASFVDIYNNEQFPNLNQWPPELYVVLMDFNFDDRLDLLVSANYYTNASAGEIWYVFKQNAEGYQFTNRPIEFFADAAILSPEPATKSVTLFHLHSGGSHTAALIEIHLSDLGVETRVLQHYDWEKDADVAHWEALSNGKERVRSYRKRLNFGSLMQKYADRIKGDIHDRTLYLDSPSKDLPIDTRDPQYSNEFVSLDEAYALLGKSASALSEARADDLLGKTVSTPIQSGALPDKLENALPVEVDVRRQAVPEGTTSEIQGLKSVEAQDVESESATGFPRWIAIFLGAVLIVGVSLWVRRIWNRTGRLVP